MNAPTTRTGGPALAALLLLPVLALAWPWFGSVLHDDVVPQATGAGFLALALLPAAAWMVLRGLQPSVRASMGLFATILVSVAWIGTDSLTDTFEASRTLLQWFTALVCCLAGASLDASGRRVLAHGAVTLTLAFAGYALFNRDRALTGALGNTGSISEVALPGAVIGAVSFACARGPWRWIGLAAFVVFLSYVLAVPVLAGSACAAATAAIVFVTRRGTGRPWLLVAIVLAAAAFVFPFARARRAPVSPPPSASTALVDATGVPDPAVVSDPSGGLGVRLLVWKGCLAMFADHPIAGSGTGQFAARFPQYRSVEEIERTTHGRRVAEETEVEHPHNDWIAPWLDTGILGGIGWALFLVTAGWCAWRKLQVAFAPGDASATIDLALAAAVIAVLGNALVRGPLLQNPASAPVAFAAIGIVLARPVAGGIVWPRRFVVIGAFVLLAVVSPRAWAFVRHGWHLQQLAVPRADKQRVAEIVSKAVEACPDSVVARSSAARISEARGDGLAVVLDQWQHVLDLRPLRIEALMQVGNRLGPVDPAPARAAYGSVLLLDPGHPAALQNLGTLELNAGRVAVGLSWFDRIPAHRAPSRGWLEGLAARLALRGLDDASEAVFARADPAWAARTPEQCQALAIEAEKANRASEIVDAWKARAHRGWARDHARAGRFADAVRSYRQDLRVCTIHVQSPRRVQLELAAALWRDGRDADAQAQAAGLVPTAEDLAAMPDWAGETLRARLAEAKK